MCPFSCLTGNWPELIFRREELSKYPYVQIYKSRDVFVDKITKFLMFAYVYKFTTSVYTDLIFLQ